MSVGTAPSIVWCWVGAGGGGREDLCLVHLCVPRAWHNAGHSKVFGSGFRPSRTQSD